ncbi:MAG: helix-turn-helix domain-containing protein [Polyangia bacterium]
MSAADDLQLLLVEANDRRPVLPRGLSGAATGAVPKTEASAQQPAYLWEEGGDPNDLTLQRWGLIVPGGPVGDRRLAQLAPLVALRQGQQGGHTVRVFRAPAQLDEVAAARWRKQNLETGQALSIDTPRYLLIAGDLDEVSLPLQQVLQTDTFVGRIAFREPSGYEAYVDKVLRAERAARASAAGRCLLYTVHDGTSATGIGHQSLVAPGAELLLRAQRGGQLAASVVQAAGDEMMPSPGELLALAGRTEPAVLLSMSHGEGPPRGGWRSADEQRRSQGAMSFGSEGRLSGDDLSGRRFLPHGLWMMVACYGAGTPALSAYKPWLEELRRLGQYRGAAEAVLAGLPKSGERPFVAALPQAVLASPDGPLGFIGHMDLAWTYGFADLDSGPQAVPRPARFAAALRSALRGDRIGIACRELMRVLGQTQTELMAIAMQAALTGVGPDEALRARRGHLWMLRQDLLGYVLLGDPAVRLPVPGQAPAAGVVAGRAVASDPGLAGGPGSAYDLLGLPGPPADERAGRLAPAPRPAPPRAQAPTLPLPLERLEEAIGHALVGDRGPGELARSYGLSRSELEGWVDRYRRGGRRALSEPEGSG